MSKGIGSGCTKLHEDENEVVYSYYCYDLNVPEHRNEEHIADGQIIFKKEPHEVLSATHMAELLKNGTITIKNSSNAWTVLDGTDYMVLPLCLRILKGYQEDGQFLGKCSHEV
ncbi:hypothetical protein [Ruminococcus sp.]|uniref:hypothetical protein n=1 Tax=Ruminococcus sp. TaxID=41978 RepID=UPI0025D86EE3|nr:hypothetical protein [Ruminococcus sp.]MBQ9542951.1 hypothetical protein [Ruminococcus sp.]